MNGSTLSRGRRAGKVWLIGAGPGDAELLTLKAVRVLGEADVVLVDDLVNRDILLHARSSARVIGVGKRGGCKSTPQAFIDRLMVRLAKSGATLAAVQQQLKCGTGCGSCMPELRRLARDHTALPAVELLAAE